MSTETDTSSTAVTDREPGDGSAPAAAKVSPFAGELAVIEVSDAALETVMGIRADEEDAEGLGLRIEVTGTKGTDYTYDLSFDELANVEDDDVIVDATPDLKIIVPLASVDRLRGSVLDLPRNASQGGLVIRNPNRPDPLAGVKLDLEGSIADKVAQLLEQAINPSLASHGGYATLVGVDEADKVYITMGGGCQGCSMSRLTLTEGIDRQIREAIPEVVAVIDATDHAAGENPFFE